MPTPKQNQKRETKVSAMVTALLPWFAQHARDLPWRHTRDPYAIHVSEIMLQQTQVKTVIPFWERWLRELPTIEAAAQAPSDKIHKLWEGLGYYTRVRNLQKAAQIIVEKHGGKFPKQFDEVVALPGIGRYTAGAICSIAFNQPTPIVDGNVIRVLTRVFGVAENPKEKGTNAKLWRLAEELVAHAARLNLSHSSRRKEAHSQIRNPKPETRYNHSLLTSAATVTGLCSALNQSLMELGALICTTRNPQCQICPVKKLCFAFKENRVAELPSPGKREAATTRHFIAFVVEHQGKFLVRQRPAGIVNAHLWEFPNIEITTAKLDVTEIFQSIFRIAPPEVHRLCTVKHSITRYRLTLEACRVQMKKVPKQADGIWLTPAQMQALAFTSAHRKVWRKMPVPMTLFT
jgi:A/G-specific adenine glycosylase